mmetsp:Transcript_55518/g.104316  ORF Transcript_55518/g.104316 Transcript_55518/m.104316 type:complete len:209 (+) Transcript_55518:816-1442(+)
MNLSNDLYKPTSSHSFGSYESFSAVPRGGGPMCACRSVQPRPNCTTASFSTSALSCSNSCAESESSGTHSRSSCVAAGAGGIAAELAWRAPSASQSLKEFKLIVASWRRPRPFFTVRPMLPSCKAFGADATADSSSDTRVLSKVFPTKLLSQLSDKDWAVLTKVSVTTEFVLRTNLSIGTSAQANTLSSAKISMITNTRTSFRSTSQL